MAAMEKMGIRRLRIKDKEQFEIELERQGEGTSHPVPVFSHPEAHHRFPTHTPPHRGPIEEKVEEKKEEGKFITSPMVGTLYSSPSPDDPPFVKVGDRVEENSIVCIIEAMKVMNEVKAGIAGTVAEILVDSAHPVEFGTKILRVIA